MSRPIEACDELINFLYENSKITKEQFLYERVRERTEEIVKRYDAAYDKLIAQFEAGVRSGDIKLVKRCARKLASITSRNAAYLNGILRRLS